MMLLAAVHSAAGTFHSLAAACTSIMRAVAPPLRTYSCDVRMPRLPPVEKSPHARLRATLSPGVGYSVVTFDQSHSSSSATSWARPVSVPCPISERTTRITTVSSGLITTQALTSGAASAAAAEVPNGTWKSTESPPATAAEPARNLRRDTSSAIVMVLSRIPGLAAARLAALGGELDRGTDAVVGAAAADIGDLGVDVVVGRLR